MEPTIIVEGAEVLTEAATDVVTDALVATGTKMVQFVSEDRVGTAAVIGVIAVTGAVVFGVYKLVKAVTRAIDNVSLAATSNIDTMTDQLVAAADKFDAELAASDLTDVGINELDPEVDTGFPARKKTTKKKPATETPPESE